jgi:SnoaL-like domain
MNMNALTTDTTAALSDLRQLRDRNELLDLIDGYFLASGRGPFDDAWAASVFTSDIELIYPVAKHTGLQGMADVHQLAFDRYDRTQHLHSSHVLSLTEDEAVIGSNVVIFHVHLPETRAQRGDDSPFIVGDYIEARVVRTAHGWRIRRLEGTKIWQSGRPPADLAGPASPYGA